MGTPAPSNRPARTISSAFCSMRFASIRMLQARAGCNFLLSGAGTPPASFAAEATAVRSVTTRAPGWTVKIWTLTTHFLADVATQTWISMATLHTNQVCENIRAGGRWKQNDEIDEGSGATHGNEGDGSEDCSLNSSEGYDGEACFENAGGGQDCVFALVGDAVIELDLLAVAHDCVCVKGLFLAFYLALAS